MHLMYIHFTYLIYSGLFLNLSLLPQKHILLFIYSIPCIPYLPIQLSEWIFHSSGVASFHSLNGFLLCQRLATSACFTPPIKKA